MSKVGYQAIHEAVIFGRDDPGHHATLAPRAGAVPMLCDVNGSAVGDLAKANGHLAKANGHLTVAQLIRALGG